MRITELVRSVALIGSLGFIAGCATIVEGTDQTIAVSSDPTGAVCEFTREGEPVAFVNPTPGSVTLDKSSEDVTVRCSKEAYEDEVVSLTSKFEGMTFGNIILGGIIGVGVDAASGAMHHYPENLNIILAPTSFDSVEERDIFYDARRQQISAEVAAAIQTIRKDCLPDSRIQCDKDVAELEAQRDAKLAEMEVKRSRAAIEAKEDG